MPLRTNSEMPAKPVSPEIRIGKARCLSVSMVWAKLESFSAPKLCKPDIGSQLCATPVQYINIKANQKPGIAKPMNTKIVILRSGSLFWVSAEIMPKGIAMLIINAKLSTLIRSVIGKASCIMPFLTLPSASVSSQNTGL